MKRDLYAEVSGRIIGPVVCLAVKPVGKPDAGNRLFAELEIGALPWIKRLVGKPRRENVGIRYELPD
jgi:hypothetical protein